MKLNQGQRRILIGVLIVTGILATHEVYAILSSVTVHNNVTVTPGVGIGLFVSSTDPTTCPVLGSPSYSIVSPFTNTISWSITAGGSQTEWFCIENQGSGNDNAPSITIASIATTFTCTTTPCFTLATVPTTIPALPAQSVSAPVGVTLTASPSTSGSGNVDITVS